MKDFIATFHTHLSAMRTYKALSGVGVSAQLSPVPRKLSASCGTCVRYRAEEPHLGCMDQDCEKVVAVLPQERYEVLFEND